MKKRELKLKLREAIAQRNLALRVLERSLINPQALGGMTVDHLTTQAFRVGWSAAVKASEDVCREMAYEFGSVSDRHPGNACNTCGDEVAKLASSK